MATVSFTGAGTMTQSRNTYEYLETRMGKQLTTDTKNAALPGRMFKEKALMLEEAGQPGADVRTC